MKKWKMKKRPSGSEKFLKTNKFLKIISEENRLKILLSLKGGLMNVTQIHKKLKLPQNLTSHHISKLKEIGLLNEKHEGTFRQYSINLKKLKEFNKVLKELLGI